MRCPFCNYEDTKVIDSRPADEQNAIRRRRECGSCGKRFTTYERLERFPMMVIKKDETREAYDRTKAEKGIMLACHKRPVSAQQIRELVDAVESEVISRGEREIPSTEIGEMVMSGVKELDPVAYVRFASVYREFKDVDSFMDELKTFLK